MYDAPAQATEAELRALEAAYCSWGDTVHYLEHPKFFDTCEGSYMYDAEGRAFLDLQMWYSAVNFGYRNPRLNAVAHRQLDTLPQVASQYLHREKVELAATIARDMEAKFGSKGRVHFNVGGAQAVEDSLKIVRNASGGKSLMFAFEGGYHGRTLGASAITSSYRYRRRYGHFGDRAQFIEFPYHFRGPRGMSKEEYGEACVAKFARLFETEYNGVLDTKTGQAEFAAFYVEPIQGTGGYVIPPPNFFTGIKKVLDQHGILMVVDEIQMGMYRTGKLWSIEHFGVTPDVLVFGKALTNGLNPLSGLWAREELINPTVFPPGSTHSTFNANPMGTAVALETLRMCAELDYGRTVAEKGAYFLDGLKALQMRWPQIGDVDGLGLALRCEICEADGYTPNKKLLDRMEEEAMRGDLEAGGRRMGLILDVGGYHKNVITLAPSLEITFEEIDLALELLDNLLRRCTAA
ncbi:MAG: aminotransferase class III-fold pyridoxal phosphate-dependent enzyme [Alphaproteobacteria bacterium]|nr:aminotransferase class III-fold pyridoxal phosphate-dependent enzyme [Alphaproteobacteria bacterium]MBU1516430.1 aminotransferase class III-fold pyridoxal phosphate-dependent enzyme [Alphaproteobacteria bacterium]MBU2093333.1 aminotransferase class III-fold pyridoxal phosphate-dependent enzyme [Alphaproteobacteria bacterium]MBU2153820.1 aminotransferase class III-fold pyridoxal phosphate-dependent enzyme [Alphaproteobacteria bacterium]MBU2307692.1 aminotransferase class III-fold pyridoxal ph